VIISVTGRHLEIGDDIKTYIVKKLEGFAKYSSKIVEAKVIIEALRGIYKFEIVIVADHTKYYGDSEDADIRAAADKAIKRMDSQLRSHKQKVARFHKKRKRVSDTEEMAEEIDEVINEDYIE
jgi:putative sigma-54 modulation protein